MFGEVDLSRMAALAEYTVADASKVVRIPAGVSFVDAAALPVIGTTALQVCVDT